MKAVTITAPVKGFKGLVAGVQFVDGVGETTDANALNYFRRHGYTIGDGKSGSAATAEPTVDQLKEILAERGLDTKGKKAELIERLAESDAAIAAATADASA